MCVSLQGQLCMHTAVLHPTNMQKLIASTLDDGRSGVSAEDRSRWAGVTASLQLSADQKSQILSLRQIFLRRMSKVGGVCRTRMCVCVCGCVWLGSLLRTN